ncbi:MAG TPA: hypothetical protein VMU01_11605 [Rhizomicrobium sp.]|nr:hypothetical protein [Rhizomicrobium sp.]
MTAESEKINLIIAMAERLVEAIEADIAALKAGRPQEMRTLDPEIQRLSAIYGREVTNLDPARTRKAPAELRRRLVAVTSKFKDALGLHARLVTRVKNASEGIVKAVADEVERRRAPMCTYSPAASAYRPAKGAIVFNSVV